MNLEIAAEVVTACDYNQQLSVSGRIDTAIVTPSFALKGERSANGSDACANHNCFKFRVLIAEQFTIVWVFFCASCGFCGVGSGL